MALHSLIRSLARIKFSPTTNRIFLQCPSHRLRVICYSTEEKNAKRQQSKIPQNISTFVLTKYTNYIKNFENLLAKRFPKAMTMYRGFMDGVSLFYKDVKQYVIIIAKVNGTGKGLNELTRRELEIYCRVPQEMLKLAPVLIGSALPLGYTVMMPLAYWFPKTLLTDHFWTPAQREQFHREAMIARVRQSDAIIKMLTAPNICLQRHIADEKLWILVQAEMKTNQLIYPHKLIGCIDLFKGAPFHMDRLSRMHIIHLAKLHDISTLWFPKKRLKQRAALLLAMDRAIIREGGIKQLSLEDMRFVCRLRGLHAEEMDAEAMKQWLNKWMHISVSADDSSLSFPLHASAILGYNAPANRKLLRTAGNALSKLRLSGRAAFKRMTH